MTKKLKGRFFREDRTISLTFECQYNFFLLSKILSMVMIRLINRRISDVALLLDDGDDDKHDYDDDDDDDEHNGDDEDAQYLASKIAR